MNRDIQIAPLGMGCSGFFVAMLGILFIGLKLTGYIDWSWLWVLSPLWIGPGLVLLVFVVIFGAALILKLISLLFFFASKMVGKLARTRDDRG